MEDWLGIVLGILFILGPALLEKGNKKKRRAGRRAVQLPQQEPSGTTGAPDSEMTEVQLPEIKPVYVPVPSEEPVIFPEEAAPCEPVVSEPAVSGYERPAAVSAVPDKAASVPAQENNPPARRKLRINGRDMIIYSEILKPKF